MAIEQDLISNSLQRPNLEVSDLDRRDIFCCGRTPSNSVEEGAIDADDVYLSLAHLYPRISLMSLRY